MFRAHPVKGDAPLRLRQGYVSCAVVETTDCNILQGHGEVS
jgi:hypothetical protein